MKAHESSKSLFWYQAKDGNTYICDRYEIGKDKNLSDEEIKRACSDEQDKPWND